MDFLQELGKVALGSRLRRLGEIFAADAAKVYEIYGVSIQPKWFPVFYLLSEQGECSITFMSKSIGCSHPVVSQVVKEMEKAGLIETGKSVDDARVNVVKLSAEGKELIPNMKVQLEDVNRTVEVLFEEMQYDFWKGLEEIEFLLDEKCFFDRVMKQRKERESGQVEIIEYKKEYHDDFKRLNYAWIEQHFTIEEKDRRTLENPQTEILAPGGVILLAKFKSNIVGTCALQKRDSSTFELIKMTVSENFRQRNIGWKIGNAILEKARLLGAERVVIESNTKLKPAINLYKKLGFERISAEPSPFQRCNMQMQITL